MSIRADFALYDRKSKLIALVEAKKKTGTSEEWAAGLRRNMLAHEGVPNTEFFMIVTPDHLYMWKEASEEPEKIRPDYSTNSLAVLQPYAEKAGIRLDTISPSAFELLILMWLSDLVQADMAPENMPPDQQWLFQSGFISAIRKGRIEYDVAA